MFRKSPLNNYTAAIPTTEGVQYVCWARTLSEKRFISIQEWLYLFQSKALGCGIGSVVEIVSSVHLCELRRQNNVLFGAFYCAHYIIHKKTSLDSLRNSTASEWNGALDLFRQNIAIMLSIRQSVLAPAFTSHIQKSHWGGPHNLTEEFLTLLDVQANKPLLTKSCV